MDEMQVAYGRLRWLPPDEGGLRQPLSAEQWVRPAWIEPGGIDQVASLVLENIEPGADASDNVKASWLAWETLPAPEWALREGDVLAITEGTRAVAYLTIERIDV